MARHLRVEYPGAIYHVTCRMVGDWSTERTFLFKDDADHERFLDRLAERVGQFNIRLYLFVCMTNHFHLVFETPEANCSKFMQSLSTAYTVYYNLRHGRHGHLLDGRFKAKLVEGDDSLLALSRYVHLNPVRIGSMEAKPIEERIQALRAYRWSSDPSYIGKRKTLDFIEYGYAAQSQRDVADLLNVGSGSAVCKQLKKLPEKIAGDRDLNRRVRQAEAKLSAARSAGEKARSRE